MTRQKSTIFGIFSETMASPLAVIDEAFNSLPAEKKKTDYIKSNFSALVSEIESSAYELYKKYEKDTGTGALVRHFDLDKKEILSATLVESLKVSFGDLNMFFLSLGQSRKSRAGKTFEIIIKRLFKSLDYPFDEQVVINGKPDFLLPGEKHYREHGADCIIFTAKRTLRERWRQIVTEGIRGQGFFLATIDDKVTESGLKEMKNNRIYLVVPTHLKESINHYKNALNVLPFEVFFKHHLDPAMQRWKENGVI